MWCISHINRNVKREPNTKINKNEVFENELLMRQLVTLMHTRGCPVSPDTLSIQIGILESEASK